MKKATEAKYKKIRSRVTYKEYSRMHKWLTDKARTPMEIIEMFVHYMDDKHMLHSETHAEYAHESCKQLKKDIKEDGFEF